MFSKLGRVKSDFEKLTDLLLHYIIINTSQLKFFQIKSGVTTPLIVNV